MNPSLPQVLERYFAAQNAHDTMALLDCFTADALVHDEGRNHQGLDAIRAWSDDVISRYNLSLKVLEAAANADEALVKAEVSGSFDGSPAEITYLFRFSDAGLIRSLEVP